MANDLALIVGRNIAAARAEKGIKTQRELATLLSQADPEMAATNTRVSIWERGQEAPSQRYMRSLVEVLGKSIDWFYTDHAKLSETPAPTPDLFPFSVRDDQLARIEQKLDWLIAALRPEPEAAAPKAPPQPQGDIGRFHEGRPPTAQDAERPPSRREGETGQAAAR